MALPWTHPNWTEESTAWIENHLTQLRYQLTGPIAQHYTSQTSHVLHVPTDQGSLYFKASAPLFSHETAITDTLARLWPGFVPQVITADTTRSWLLMSDANPTLRDLTKADHDMDRWAEMLRRYTLLQHEATSRIDQLVAAGVPDRRLARLPDLLGQLLVDRPALMIGETDGLPEADYERLLGIRPELESQCQDLAAYGIPETLHHDDFHAGHAGLPHGEFIFFDWAECCVAHPFYSLMMSLRSAKYTYTATEQELLRLRDVYLGGWTTYGPMERLLEAFGLATRLGALCRTLTWYHVASHAEDPTPFRDAVPYWLGVFLHHTALE